MGKRKSSSKPVGKKRAEPLATTFKCLFCHHDKSVSVKLDKHVMFGHLNCKVCGQSYSTPINNLSAAVDVYCDWKDACEELHQQQPPKKRPPRAPQPISHGIAGGAAFDNREVDLEAEADADGEVDPDLEEDDSRSRPRNGADADGKKDRLARANAYDDDEDDDEDDDVDLDQSAREKRRRVADYDVDEEEDED